MEFLDRINRKKKRNKIGEDVLLLEQSDRRLMPDVPAMAGETKLMDQRGSLPDSGMTFDQISEKRKIGIRYLNAYEIAIIVYQVSGKLIFYIAVSGGIYKKLQSWLETKKWAETLWLGFIFLISLSYVVGSTGHAALYAGF